MGSSLACTARRLAVSLLLAVVVCSGCSDSIPTPGHQAFVRVINASANAQAIDVNYATTQFVVNQGTNTFSNYAQLSPGQVTVSVYPTGAKQATVQVLADCLAAEEYSVYVTDSGASYQATILDDQITPPPPGYVSVHFLQQALGTGKVDIYFVPNGSTLPMAKPLLTAVIPGTVSSYINVPIGTYAIVIFPTGTKTPAVDPVVYTSAPTQFLNGQVRTLLIVDQQLVINPAVNVIIGSDLN